MDERRGGEECMDIMTNFFKVTKEQIGEEATVLFEYALDLAPYLGKFLQARKIWRAEKRIKEHSKQLKEIQKLYSSEILSRDFIQERVGPIFLADFIEEHEDAKIVYILNGVENIFINNNTDESLIIYYYDTLRELRYEDIRKLYYYSAITDDPYSNITLNSPRAALSQQIYIKLEKLYLIKSAKTYNALQHGPEMLSEEDRRVELTDYGKEFIKFISKDFDIEKYEDKIRKYEVAESERITRNVKASFG